jgi:adenylate kinase
MRIILLGAPGSGKGTQGNLIAGRYGFPKISSGDLLRKAVTDRTPIGIEADEAMKKGELVKDTLVVKMIKERIDHPDCQQGYTLDGFPRTVPQALLFEEACYDDTEIAIEIYIDDTIVIDRLTARVTCSRCGNIYNLLRHSPEKDGICDLCEGKLEVRSDDQKDVIEDRLIVYHGQRQALVNHYQKKKVYACVDGDADANTVFENICSLIDEKIVQRKENRTVQ